MQCFIADLQITKDITCVELGSWKNNGCHDTWVTVDADIVLMLFISCSCSLLFLFMYLNLCLVTQAFT